MTLLTIHFSCLLRHVFQLTTIRKCMASIVADRFILKHRTHFINDIFSPLCIRYYSRGWIFVVAVRAVWSLVRWTAIPIRATKRQNGQRGGR